MLFYKITHINDVYRRWYATYCLFSAARSDETRHFVINSQYSSTEGIVTGTLQSYSRVNFEIDL